MTTTLLCRKILLGKIPSKTIFSKYVVFAMSKSSGAKVFGSETPLKPLILESMDNAEDTLSARKKTQATTTARKVKP
jgi:hypothetical protein